MLTINGARLKTNNPEITSRYYIPTVPLLDNKYLFVTQSTIVLSVVILGVLDLKVNFKLFQFSK